MDMLINLLHFVVFYLIALAFVAGFIGIIWTINNLFL